MGFYFSIEFSTENNKMFYCFYEVYKTSNSSPGFNHAMSNSNFAPAHQNEINIVEYDVSVSNNF